MNKEEKEALVKRKDYKKLLSEFDVVLKSDKEQDIHDFLYENNWLLYFHFWDWYGFVLSKHKLADKYIPDFVIVGEALQSLCPEITFIEIERANENLFTKSGDPTSFLTHAIRQVQDWKRWVSENRNYLKDEVQKLILEEKYINTAKKHIIDRLFENIALGYEDNYIIVAGRRNSMTMDDRLRLAQMNKDLHGIRIITYDALIDKILRILYFYNNDFYYDDAFG